MMAKYRGLSLALPLLTGLCCGVAACTGQGSIADGPDVDGHRGCVAECDGRGFGDCHGDAGEADAGCNGDGAQPTGDRNGDGAQPPGDRNGDAAEPNGDRNGDAGGGGADGDCITTCDDGDPCTEDLMTGSPERCDVVCTHQAIDSCTYGDNCCPPSCGWETDPDCNPSFGRTKVVDGLADPAVYYDEQAQRFVMSGTAADTRFLELYYGTTATSFELRARQELSLLDPNRTFCGIWAPDINKVAANTYKVTVVATVVDSLPGESAEEAYSRCYTAKSRQEAEETLFDTTATYDNGSFTLTTPVLLTNAPPSAPNGYEQWGCRPGLHCERTMRIDAEEFLDPETQRRWTFYNWFGGGNKISSYPHDDPSYVVRNLEFDPGEEAQVNEAADVFYRNGTYYLIYSRGRFTSNYGLSYLKGSSVTDLVSSDSEERATKQILMDPVYMSGTSGCDSVSGQRVLDAGGHSQVVRVANRDLIYYHANRFRISGGCHQYDGRDTYVSDLTFLPNGNLKNLRSVLFWWHPVYGGFTYSLDIKSSDTFAPACLSAGDIGENTWAEFHWRCSDGTVFELGEDLQYRVCTTNGDEWGQTGFCPPWRDVTGLVHRATFDGLPPPNYITVRHSGKCLHQDGGADYDGANISQWNCADLGNFQLQVIPAGGGYYYLKFLHSGKCVALTSATGNINQWTCINHPNLKWRLDESAGDGFVYLVNENGDCILQEGAVQDNGANIAIGPCQNAAHVQWQRVGLSW